MKEIRDYEKDIASIRSIMERSSKFISLSGLSGILAGVYALIGATAAYFIIQYPVSPLNYRTYSVSTSDVLWKLVALATVILAASIATGLLFSNKKAKQQGVKLWNETSKLLFINLTIPLVTGGLFTLIILYNGHYGLAAPAMLIFYGLALIQGSSNTYDEVRYLGYSEILLGLISALFPGYGLIFWSIGFGVLHIFYGFLMYKKYEK